MQHTFHCSSTWNNLVPLCVRVMSSTGTEEQPRPAVPTSSSRLSLLAKDKNTFQEDILLPPQSLKVSRVLFPIKHRAVAPSVSCRRLGFVRRKLRNILIVYLQGGFREERASFARLRTTRTSRAGCWGRTNNGLSSPSKDNRFHRAWLELLQNATNNIIRITSKASRRKWRPRHVSRSSLLTR